jgi:hypothetical protein
VLEPGDSGPRLKDEALIWNAVPENVMETGVSKSQGTFRMLISRSIDEETRAHTVPSPRADILGTRNLVINGRYALGVTNDLGGASVDDSTLTADDRLSVDRNTVERALPIPLQYSLGLSRGYHRAFLPVS